MQKPDPIAIAAAGGVTPAYARMLIAGTRKPSLACAVKIFDATGLQFGPLVGLDKRQINVARTMTAEAA